ncbi:MAG: hypothetical protein J6Y04_05310 [Bacteroidaceae bacterium]|jgi:hypothetical protein|nr:hypothetical protein [Bacteroidaceae bacterium]MBQ6188953.1 hypothetical protein [Bacteroidaceae bacterium]
MKKAFYLFVSLATIATMISCDSKKNEIKNLTMQFVSALNEQDRVTVYDMFPSAKSLMELIPEGLDIKKLKITIDDSTGNYIATLNDKTGQRLVFKTDSTGAYKIEDTYGVLNFDSIIREFAIKTGIPIKDISDRKFAELMNEDSMFMSNLTLKHFDELHGNLSKVSGYWNWGHQAGAYYLHIFQTIKNNGDIPVKGEDYNVEFRLADYGANGVSTTKVIPGVDLAPGETIELTTDAPAFYKAANNKTLMADVVIKFKNMSTQALMLKYAKLTGEEYKEYLQTLKEYEEAIENLSDEDGELPDDFDSLPDED